MKDFLKMVLAVIVGIVVVSVVSSFLCIAVIGAFAAIGSAASSTPKSFALLLDLSTTAIAEQSQEGSPWGGITNMPAETIGLWDAVQAINTAAEDPAVKYLYIKSDGNVTSIASLYEVRQALEKFRAGGKAIVAYTDSPSTGSYYISSVADKIYMSPHPGATSTFVGVGSQMFFLKDLLDKLGVNVQLIRHGKYKSAGETFIRNSPSEENREQYQVMVNSMWNVMAAEICESRGISPEALNAALDQLKLCTPQDFLEQGLVDELLTRDQMQDKLAALAVADRYKDVKWMTLSDYSTAKVLPSKVKNKIAVIYADGEIIDGKDKKDVAGDRFASVIQGIREDESVKAVVLRVNSPGGAVMAAEKIKHELDLLKQQKPLIASYGDYAASGGYWISAAADKIFSDPVTLTGSIGVFGMIPDLSNTLKDVAHVNAVSITSNKHGDMFSMMRPFGQAEHEFMQTQIEGIYTRFTNLVSEGRGLTVDAVDEVGQGRVWTGADAIDIKLVDEIGTLEDAVHYAAVAAGDADLSNWNVKAYPKPQTQMEMILEMLGSGTASEEEALLKLAKDFTKPQVVARLPYNIVIR